MISKLTALAVDLRAWRCAVLGEFDDRLPRDKNGLSVGLFEFHVLSPKVRVLLLEERSYPFEKRVSINNLLSTFLAVHVVSLADIHGFGWRFLWLCLLRHGGILGES